MPAQMYRWLSVGRLSFHALCLDTDNAKCRALQIRHRFILHQFLQSKIHRSPLKVAIALCHRDASFKKQYARRKYRYSRAARQRAHGNTHNQRTPTVWISSTVLICEMLMSISLIDARLDMMLR